MFLTLGCFFMMISCLRVIDKQTNENQLLLFFQKRCTDERFSNGWKLAFYFMKHVQFLVLMYLFVKGISNLNNLKNLGYMMFFVLYTAYEQLYRKTSILLLLFTSSFIIGQYAFSFIYPLFISNALIMKTTFKWLNLYPPSNSIDDPFNFGNSQSMYFKMLPEFDDWIVLTLLNVLSQVNLMFRMKQDIIKLEDDIKNNTKDQFEKLTYYYGRV
jgi:hypothetical protein